MSTTTALSIILGVCIAILVYCMLKQTRDEQFSTILTATGRYIVPHTNPATKDSCRLFKSDGDGSGHCPGGVHSDGKLAFNNLTLDNDAVVGTATDSINTTLQSIRTQMTGTQGATTLLTNLKALRNPICGTALSSEQLATLSLSPSPDCDPT